MALFRKRPKNTPPPAAPEPSGAERRRWPRIKLDARVVIAYPDVEKLISGPLSDISLGGLFIRTAALRPVGTRVTLKVMITREPLEFEVRGQVVRTVSVEQSRDTGATPGMGIQFEDLGGETRAALERLIAAASDEGRPAP